MAAATALILVDVQQDFLDRPGLIPGVPVVTERLAALLAGCRKARTPVAHVQTITGAGGADRMPHWVARGISACVAGTPGAAPPPALAPAAGEPVMAKQFFSGFGVPQLAQWLDGLGVRRLVLAGLYLHGCVRATALDGYQLGYEVWVAEDAVATPDAVHGATSREWLDGRAASFLPVDEVVHRLAQAPEGRKIHLHRDPTRSGVVLAEVPMGGSAEVRVAARVASGAQPAWAATAATARGEVLDRVATGVESVAGRLTDMIVEHVGKPRLGAEDEVRRAVGHLRAAAVLARGPLGRRQHVAPGVVVRRRAVGVIGLVMPWNNPLALPVGKLAPALAFGNAVVLKPAPEGTALAETLLEIAGRAGVPPGLVGMVTGGREAAEALCDDPDVDAVAVTGSIATGRALAARCALRGIPLQGELGGNNAVIVLADADIESVAPVLVRSAFSFAGQRCTAPRRFVVEAAAVGRFAAAAVAAARALVVGDPREPVTDVGPLISTAARNRVAGAVEQACAGGARILCGGGAPTGLEGGAWYSPTLLADVDPAAPIAHEETFGPVAVLLAVADIDEALTVANGVSQGLVLTVCTTDERAIERVLAEGQAGIVGVGAGPLAVHPDAPFGGWKASGIGPPEHGEWDAEFFTRIQAVYGAPPC